MCPEREIRNYEIEKWYPLRVGYYVQIIDGYFYIHLQDMVFRARIPNGRRIARIFTSKLNGKNSDERLTYRKRRAKDYFVRDENGKICTSEMEKEQNGNVSI